VNISQLQLRNSIIIIIIIIMDVGIEICTLRKKVAYVPLGTPCLTVPIVTLRNKIGTTCAAPTA
jgi:hypothetical protein